MCVCVSVPGHPFLEEPYKGVCYRMFLQTLQSRKPPNVEDLVFCTVSTFHTAAEDFIKLGLNHFCYLSVFFFPPPQLLQSALKGMQCFLNGGKWKAGPDQDLGSLLAVLKVTQHKLSSFIHLLNSSYEILPVRVMECLIYCILDTFLAYESSRCNL